VRNGFLFVWLAFAGAAFAQISVTPLVGLDRDTRDPSLSPEGKTLAFDWCKPDYTCGVYTRPFADGPATLFAGEDDHGAFFASSPRWSPDGLTLAFTRFYSHWDVHLVMRSVAGGAERDLGNVCGGQASWGPDSRAIVASRQSDPEVCRPTLYSAVSGQRIRQLAQAGNAPAFSPDGRMVAFTVGKGIQLLTLTADYRSEGPVRTIVREPNGIYSLIWTRDGKQIVYQSRADAPYLRRVAVQPGARPQKMPDLPTDITISELLPDGSALGTETTQVEALWRADLQSTPLKLETVPDADCSGGDTGCSPDGRLRVFVTTRTGVPAIWIANAGGTNGRPLVRSIPRFLRPENGGFPKLGGWSPDGKWIAFTVFPAHGNADLRSRLYVVPSAGGPLRQLAKDVYAINTPSWSPDGKLLYASRGWPIEGPEHKPRAPLVRIDLAEDKVTELSASGIWPRVSPDGKFLYFFTSPRSKLSRIRVDGGVAERLSDNDFLWFASAVGARYLYLFRMPPRDSTGQIHTIVRFDPETRQASVLAEIPFQPRFAQLSPDERFLYFGQQDEPKSRIVLVRGIF
jgi:Tol biopolymer transport system component